MKKVKIKLSLSLAIFFLFQISTAMIAQGQQIIHGTAPSSIARFGLKPISQLAGTERMNHPAASGGVSSDGLGSTSPQAAGNSTLSD